MGQFGYAVLGLGGSHPNRGNPPLTISVNSNGIRDFIAEGIIGEGEFPQTTSAGAIDFTAIASGGDGSYSFAWTVTESGDTNNIATGNHQLSTAGTQNAAQYNTARITVSETGVSGTDPPIESSYFFNCTVTDGTGATASTSAVEAGRVVVVLVPQQ